MALHGTQPLRGCVSQAAAASDVVECGARTCARPTRSSSTRLLTDTCGAQGRRRGGRHSMRRVRCMRLRRRGRWLARTMRIAAAWLVMRRPKHDPDHTCMRPTSLVFAASSDLSRAPQSGGGRRWQLLRAMRCERATQQPSLRSTTAGPHAGCSLPQPRLPSCSATAHWIARLRPSSCCACVRFASSSARCLARACSALALIWQPGQH